jgi:hypothetical protein
MMRETEAQYRARRLSGIVDRATRRCNRRLLHASPARFNEARELLRRLYLAMHAAER